MPTRRRATEAIMKIMKNGFVELEENIFIRKPPRIEPKNIPAPLIIFE